MRWIPFLAVTLSAFMLSCQKRDSAKETLTKFVELQFQKNQTINGLLEYLDGSAKEVVDQMGPDEQKKFLETENHRKESFVIEHENCIDVDNCTLTYKLKYKVLDKEVSKDSTGYEVAVKKIVKLHQSSNRWKIVDIANVKTNIEAEKPLNP